MSSSMATRAAALAAKAAAAAASVPSWVMFAVFLAIVIAVVSIMYVTGDLKIIGEKLEAKGKYVNPDTVALKQAIADNTKADADNAAADAAAALAAKNSIAELSTKLSAEKIAIENLSADVKLEGQRGKSVVLKWIGGLMLGHAAWSDYAKNIGGRLPTIAELSTQPKSTSTVDKYVPCDSGTDNTKDGWVNLVTMDSWYDVNTAEPSWSETGSSYGAYVAFDMDTDLGSIIVERHYVFLDIHLRSVEWSAICNALKLHVPTVAHASTELLKDSFKPVNLSGSSYQPVISGDFATQFINEPLIIPTSDYNSAKDNILTGRYTISKDSTSLLPKLAVHTTTSWTASPADSEATPATDLGSGALLVSTRKFDRNSFGVDVYKPDSFILRLGAYFKRDKIISLVRNLDSYFMTVTEVKSFLNGYPVPSATAELYTLISSAPNTKIAIDRSYLNIGLGSTFVALTNVDDQASGFNAVVLREGPTGSVSTALGKPVALTIPEVGSV